MKKTRYFIRLANAENFFEGKFIKNEKYEYFLVIKIKGSLMTIRKIKNINGKGLMLAVNLGTPDITIKTISKCMEKGLIVFLQLYRNEYLRISPPLTISEDEIRKGCAIILEALNEDL